MSTTRRVEVPGPGTDVLPSLLAVPDDADAAGTPPGPGLLVIHDILGLSADVEGIARRFADAGYTTLVPGYFGEGMLLPCIARAATSLARRRGAHFDRLRAAADHLATLPSVDPERTGVVGFCMGGGFAVLWAARSDARAVATFYGDVPRDVEVLRGIPPCVAGYGGRDLVFAPHGRRLREHLGTLGVEHDVVEYPGAGHAYMNRHDHVLFRLSAIGPTRAGYDAEAAEDSWRRMLAFFAEHLGPDARG